MRATNAAQPGGAFAPLTGASLVLLSYATGISNDPVSISVRQPIGAGEPLRAGGYTKAIVFTVSTPLP